MNEPDCISNEVDILAASASTLLVSHKWPNLSEIGLSELDHDGRLRGIGGIDANVILSGDHERILNLWLQKRGEQPPVDLSHRFPVMLGNWTEDFNRQWYEKISGLVVSRVGHSAICAKFPWRRCTLDGYIETTNCVWEAKHTSAFAKPDEVVERYMPQLQHNMAVMKSDQATLSVIFGNHKFEIIEVASDWLYQLDLLEAEENFWDCVRTGKAPSVAPPPPPPRPVGKREICFDGSNSWASAAADWLENRQPAKQFASAVTAIKEHIEDDVSRAFGHGIEAKRSKSGALTIGEQVS